MNLEFRPGLTTCKTEIFNSSTIIKPAPNSSKFFRIDKGSKIGDAVVNQYGIDQFGQEVLLNSEPYKQERFGDTIQSHGLEFNYSKNKWLIIDPTDPMKKRVLESNSDIINELVEKCRLINQRIDHPDRGKYITSANIFDRYDPFFTHTEARISLNGGNAFLKTTNSDYLNVVVLLGLLARKKFQLGTNTKTGLSGTQVKYIVIDTQLERKEKSDKRRRDERVRETFSALDNERKLKILIALGITTINIDNPDYDLIDNLLYDFSKDFETKYQNTLMTRGEAYLAMVESPPDTIEAHYTFYYGKKTNVITILNKSYNAFGQRLGVTVKECIQLLLSPSNNLLQDILAAAESYQKDLLANRVKPVSNSNNNTDTITPIVNKASKVTKQSKAISDTTVTEDESDDQSSNISDPNSLDDMTITPDNSLLD